MLSDSINGTGDFTKLGSGAISFGKSGSLDGNFFVEEGTVEGRSNVVRGDLFINSGASIAAFAQNMVNAPDNHAEIDGTWNLNARGDDTVLSHQIGSISGSGTIISDDPTDNPGGTIQLRGDSGSSNYSGSITGLVNVEKTGSSTQVFSGSLTHTGTTEVDGGTLLIDGTHSGAGNYTVGSGGTLGGDGAISSSVIVNSGGRLAPGASAGSLAVGSVTLSSGSFFDAEIGGTNAGLQYDQLSVVGSAVLGGALQVSLLDSSGTAYEPSSSETFTILSGGSLSGSFDNVAGGERIETLGGEGTFLVTYSASTPFCSRSSNQHKNWTSVTLRKATRPYATTTVPGTLPLVLNLEPLVTSRVTRAPTSGALGDGADEDGAFFGGIGVNSSVAAVNIELSGASEGRVDAWIDFNRDGDWDDPNEKILSNQQVNLGLQTINYDLPSGLTAGDNYARVRISSGGGLGPSGLADDGEVEDYVVTIGEAPTVQSIVINGGDSQRSSVDSVQVTFDRVVDINNQGGNAFSFVHESGDVVPAVPVITESDNKTVVDFTFDSGDLRVTNFGSLEDGDYELMIDASRVTAAGVELDGNGDGTTGDDYVMSAVDGFFRKYGDDSGDAAVGLTDFASFRQAFGKSHGESGYLHGLDSNGDGEIGLTDFAAFRQNFGS